MFNQQLKLYWENVKDTYHRNELRIDENYICIVILLLAVLSFNRITTYYPNQIIQQQNQEIEELRRSYDKERS